jgi:uncharacterized LabA/DUF88 family protein
MGITMDKVSIFVDVQNIYYTTKQQHGCHFDYNAFWAEVTRSREVVKANAYAIARSDEKLKQFHNILRGIGFEVKLKPFIQRSDGTAKGDWDVGITIDIMEHAAKSNIIVLASGDGDFDLLVQNIRNKYNSLVEVYGVEKLTAPSLIRSASRFVPVEDRLLLKPGSETQFRSKAS